jgi:dolichyl-phosphate-mannose--protein O-mannosyl transferase
MAAGSNLIVLFKLNRDVPTGFKLHSHEIKYGTGSGQQSVTGFMNGDDPNSYFQIKSNFDQPTQKELGYVSGKPVVCGDTIRLQVL